MARLETIRYLPRVPKLNGDLLQWTASPSGEITDLPQLFWRSGTTWGEANLWALEQLQSTQAPIDTILRSMFHLLTYAKWLEVEEMNWWHFPERDSEKCLSRFRGALIRMRGAGEFEPSTVHECMAAVLRFYRWMSSKGLLSTEWPMWAERIVGKRITNRFGFDYTMRFASADLAIPNLPVAGAIKLEDGVLPISQKGIRELVEFTDAEASAELRLMLQLGFQTGLRIGSITDLKVQTLVNASVETFYGWHRLSVGPGAIPRVATKFGVNGNVLIPTPLLNELLDYTTSIRRLKRQALAQTKHRDLLFLTKCGGPYRGRKSRAVNVEMCRLRKAGKRAGVKILRGFHFHRTRATFATELMRTALCHLTVSDAVIFVRDACLHKDESTTLKYVRFLDASKAMEDSANAFTELFLGSVPKWSSGNA